MIQGEVTADREAVIRLTVFGTEKRQAELEVVIDTGFNDYLTLPLSTVATLALPFAAPTQATLADGTVVTMNYHHAAVDWDSERRNVLVLACDGGPLVGMSLLYGYELCVLAQDGGPVTIRRPEP